MEFRFKLKGFHGNIVYFEEVTKNLSLIERWS